MRGRVGIGLPRGNRSQQGQRAVGAIVQAGGFAFGIDANGDGACAGTQFHLADRRGLPANIAHVHGGERHETGQQQAEDMKAEFSHCQRFTHSVNGSQGRAQKKTLRPNGAGSLFVSSAKPEIRRLQPALLRSLF